MDPVNAALLEKAHEPNEDESIARVGMKAAATIHTATGLFVKVVERERPEGGSEVAREGARPGQASAGIAVANFRVRPLVWGSFVPSLR